MFNWIDNNVRVVITQSTIRYQLSWAQMLRHIKGLGYNGVEARALAIREKRLYSETYNIIVEWC